MTCVGRWGRGGAVPSSDPCDLLALMLCKFFLIEMPASLAVIPEEIEIAELMAPTPSSLWPEVFLHRCQSF